MAGGGLLQRILTEIRSSGPMSFARFMELALYDPEAGYYATGASRLGTGGDYFTAADAGRAFGRCIARQLVEVDRRIGPLEPFDVVEFGAGRGLLARDVLDALPDLDRSLAGRLCYTMVDRSDSMRSAAALQVPEAACVAPEALGGGHRGCVVAVELFDALPVQRVRRRAGRLVEVVIDVDADGRLVEREAAPTVEVLELAERFGAAPEEGFEAEVSQRASVLLETMAGCLDRGLLIIVDYGDDAAGLYGPARASGTLLAYRRHRVNTDLLARVGEQDLTAHVNFTALEERAAELGLAKLGRTTQDRFLVANGILEAFAVRDDESRHDPLAAKRRLQALQLIHPEGMGRRFDVLVLAKGCDPPPRLDGLRDPFARDADGGLAAPGGA